MGRRLAIFLCLAVVVGGIFGLVSYSAVGGTLRVGVLFPMTGEAGSYGEKGLKAVRLAQSQLKDLGRSVEIIVEDSKAEPARGVAAARKLVNVDKVPVIVGDIVSAVTLAIAPIAEQNGVVLISPTSSAPAITNAGEYIYRIWPSDLAEGREIASLAIKRGYKRVVVMHMNNDYGAAIASIFEKTLQSAGGTVLSKSGYLPSETDFRSVLSSVTSQRADAIYVAGYFADTALIVRQARELGNKTQFLGTTAIEDEKFITLAGDASEGIIYPLATGFDTNSSNTNVRSFVDAFVKRYNEQPGWVEAQVFDAFMLAIDVAGKISGSVTGKKLKEAMDNMDSYDGVAGKVKFDENGDVVKPVIFKTVRSGKFVPLTP